MHSAHLISVKRGHRCYALHPVHLLPIAIPTSPLSGTLGMLVDVFRRRSIRGSASQELLPLNQFVISVMTAQVCMQYGCHSRGCHAAALLHLGPELPFM